MSMRTALVFESPRGPYVSDAVVLACFDARFDLVLRKLLKRLAFRNPDVIRVAGGPRALASGTPLERAATLEQLRASRRLHGTGHALLVGHSDCGAYGGLAQAFDGDASRERAFHRDELARAVETMRTTLGAFAVATCFIDFERAWLDPHTGDTT
jgi:carbonic anhydrase